MNIAFYCILLLASGDPAVVVSLAGTASIQRDGQEQPLSRFARVPVGATVSTGKDSRLSLRLASGSLVRLGSDSQIEINEMEKLASPAHRQESFKLNVGRVWAKVSRLLGGESHFEIRTPTAVAGARGTAFWAEADATGSSFVVDYGSISVSAYQARPVALEGAGAGVSFGVNRQAARFRLSQRAIGKMRRRVGGASARMIGNLRGRSGRLGRVGRRGRRRGRVGAHRGRPGAVGAPAAQAPYAAPRPTDSPAGSASGG